MEETKKKGGRPPIILTEAQYEVFDKAASMGLTQDQIAILLGISEAKLKTFIKRDERIKKSWKTGRLNTNLFVIGQLMKKIQEGNVASIIFFLKTQLAWRETTHQQIDLKTPGTEIIDELKNKLFS